MTRPAQAARGRDPEATRHAILDAAEAAFGAHGFSAPSMSGIAAQAGVTKSLLHHHFGSKEGLWRAVVARRFDAYATLQASLLERSESGLDTLRDSVDALFGFLRANPSLVRLHTWANAAERVGEALPTGRELTLRGVDFLRGAQARGELHPELAPEVALVAYFCLVEHWFQARASLRQRFGDALPDDATYLRQMRDLLLRGVGR